MLTSLQSNVPFQTLKVTLNVKKEISALCDAYIDLAF